MTGPSMPAPATSNDLSLDRLAAEYWEGRMQADPLADIEQRTVRMRRLAGKRQGVAQGRVVDMQVKIGFRRWVMAVTSNTAL